MVAGLKEISDYNRRVWPPVNEISLESSYPWPEVSLLSKRLRPPDMKSLTSLIWKPQPNNIQMYFQQEKRNIIHPNFGSYLEEYKPLASS